MVSTVDEFVYHESISHVPYMISRNTKKVLIIGGGDGGCVREFIKHGDIEQIDLIEIDKRVTEVCKTYFPNCTSGLSDPRVNVKHIDGLKFLKEKENTYDIIIVDSTDPEGMALGLFTDEFYGDVYNALTENGVMAAQTENPFLDEFGIKKIFDNMRKQFPLVQCYYAPILIYPGVFWTFGLCSKGPSGLDINESKVSSMLEIEKNLKWYNLRWHRGAFMLPNFVSNMTGCTL